MTTIPQHAPQIARMLAAVAGAEWKEKWAQVNRAAGIVCGICIAAYRDDAAPGVIPHYAQAFVEAVGEQLRDRVRATERVTLIEGLAKRVAQGLVSFYEDVPVGQRP